MTLMIFEAIVHIRYFTMEPAGFVCIGSNEEVEFDSIYPRVKILIDCLSRVLAVFRHAASRRVRCLMVFSQRKPSMAVGHTVLRLIIFLSRSHSPLISMSET